MGFKWGAVYVAFIDAYTHFHAHISSIYACVTEIRCSIMLIDNGYKTDAM